MAPFEVSGQNLRWTSSTTKLKTQSKEIHPGAPPFPRVKGFRVFHDMHWCTAFLNKKSFQKQSSRIVLLYNSAVYYLIQHFRAHSATLLIKGAANCDSWLRGHLTN